MTSSLINGAPNSLVMLYFFSAVLNFQLLQLAHHAPLSFLPARARVLAVDRRVSVCPSVRPSVHLSLVGGSRKQRRAIAQELSLFDAEHVAKTQSGSPSTEAPNAGAVG